MDLSQLLETNSHAILNQCFHLHADLVVFLPDGFLVLLLQLGVVHLGTAGQVVWHLLKTRVEELVCQVLQLDVETKGTLSCC